MSLSPFPLILARVLPFHILKYYIHLSQGITNWSSTTGSLIEPNYDVSGVNKLLQARAFLEHARKISGSKLAQLENARKFGHSKMARLENYYNLKIEM